MDENIDKRSREFIKLNKEVKKVEDVPLKPKFRHIYNDMPDTKGIPQSFYPLLMIGKKAVVVELLDYKFKIATLEEWEEREIRKSYSNVNIDTYKRAYKLDTLTHCIMEIERGGNKLQFKKEDQIPLLRNMLLCMSPIVIDSLFFAYLTLLQKVEEEFNAKYKNIDQQILEQVDKAFPS
jgi:hypothetical protein